MSNKNNSHVVRFFRDNCIIEANSEALHKELWQRYRDWTHLKRMHRTVGPQSFYQRCKQAGFKPVTERKRVVKWKGVKLKPVLLDDPKLEQPSDGSGNCPHLLQGRTHTEQLAIALDRTI